MRFLLFYHSIVSDWNHGNAHFLRGVARELKARGHEVTVLEPRDGWSRSNLLKDAGEEMLHQIERSMGLEGCYSLYDPATFDPAPWVEAADVTLVHEWTPPELVARIGACRTLNSKGKLLFHDTHHRGVSAPEQMQAYDLSHYDGALVFGRSLQEVYEERGWASQVWVWHEAADVAWFYPRGDATGPKEDLVWIGNWGDGERTGELREFLFDPAGALGLSGVIHGVRYPEEGKRALRESGLRYCGWLPNHRAPEVYARHRFTAHIPRRFYTELLPGIPTIRVFEALACGIPLICAPWVDSEGLFEPDADYLVAQDGKAMMEAMRALVEDEALGARLRKRGLNTIQERHTCSHRVEELLAICSPDGRSAEPPEPRTQSVATHTA